MVQEHLYIRHLSLHDIPSQLEVYISCKIFLADTTQYDRSIYRNEIAAIDGLYRPQLAYCLYELYKMDQSHVFFFKLVPHYRQLNEYQFYSKP